MQEERRRLPGHPEEDPGRHDDREGQVAPEPGPAQEPAQPDERGKRKDEERNGQRPAGRDGATARPLERAANTLDEFAERGARARSRLKPRLSARWFQGATIAIVFVIVFVMMRRSQGSR